MSRPAFTIIKQDAFKASLAQAAGVASEAVVIKRIESISSRRHLLAEVIRVETSIMARGQAAAEQMAGRLTADSINRELSKAGLPTATVLESVKVVAVKTDAQQPPTKEAKECSLQDILMRELLILFLCGLAYLGVKAMCSIIPNTPETPVTMSNSAMTGFPTTTPTGLQNGWQACIDQAGNTYYQNLITQQTQWHHPARSTIHDGVHQRVDVFGSRFGGPGPFNSIQNQYLFQASQSLGTTNPVGPVQTPAITQELDEDASTWDRANAAFGFIKGISQRLIFVIPKLIEGGSILSCGCMSLIWCSWATSC
jgi:hypothetical protein